MVHNLGGDEPAYWVGGSSKVLVPSLKLTFSHLKMDGWNTFSFPFGAFNGLFSGANLLLVLGRVFLMQILHSILSLKPTYFSP